MSICKTPAYRRAYRLRTVEKQRAIQHRTYLKYREDRIARARRYRKSHPEMHAANEAKRRARKVNATPKWLTKEQITQMIEFYKQCPEGYEVDHIIPLRGKNVVGLHVPWNLQYLTIKENRQKSNKFDLEGRVSL